MFIETRASAAENGIQLTFIKSLNVSAYPCGRRRSQLINGPDNNNDGITNDDEKYYIPFDPEARLNTEANNRKHSSINGYTQTYIRKNWDNEALSLVLGGYLFDITLDNGYTDITTFGDAVLDTTTPEEERSAKTNIYANILVEEVALYSGFKDYTTEVLRDQSLNSTAGTEIDLLAKGKDSQDQNSYYFSGLSFSTEPLTREETAPASEKTLASSKQRVISLRILEKVDGRWQLHQPALLPKVVHGDTANSIKVDTLYTNNIKQGSYRMPSITLENVDNNVYRMHFSSIDNYIEPTAED